jgi:hypothetical protein
MLKIYIQSILVVVAKKGSALDTRHLLLYFPLK